MSIDENVDLKKLGERFINGYLPQKYYHKHCDINLYISFTITQLLNHDTLLTEEIKQYIQENFGGNYKYKEEINKQKLKAFETFSKRKNSKDINLKDKEKNISRYSTLNNNEKNSILSFNLPEFEIYFVAKLFVDELERKPECQTKLLFNSENINQYMSMRFKYKELTLNSYILLELYSMQTPNENNLIGVTKVYLFNDKMNLYQGRHIFKLINPNVTEMTNENIELDEVGKEMDSLINFYYGDEINNNENNIRNAGTLNDIELKENKNKNFNDYIYNNEKDILELKSEKTKNYEKKLNELLHKTNNCYVVLKFPSFKNVVIYEEDISKNYSRIILTELPKDDENKIFCSWVFDPYININTEDFMNKDNPISEKFSSLARGNDELFARDIRLTEFAHYRINELLNTPDFFKLDNNDITLFWSYRYELLKNNTPYALTKIMNSVKWGDFKSENEFIKNILLQWKTVEICDILYMLSRKFSINKLYPNTHGLYTNLDGMKQLRKFAVKKLGEHTNEELNFILLQLVQAIRYEDINVNNINSPLVEFLINRCAKDEVLASSLYWFIECESTMDTTNTNNKKNINKELKEITEIFALIKDNFIKNLEDKNQKILSLISNEIIFKNELVNISESLTKVSKVENKKTELRNMINTTKSDVMQNTLHYLPIDPKIHIKGTIAEQCTVFKSAKCPCKYTFNVTEDTQKNNIHEDKEHISVMFKYGDDLRQDQLILQMINYMDSLLKKVHLNYEFTIYKVLATSKSDGFVEFVSNSKTIFDILNKYNNIMLSYYKEISQNDQKTLNKYLDSYINSCAGYCVVTYILGIGDRHLENLMIDNRGRLFHIDFGFILGKDPKPAPPPIKLCKEMVDCMGGKGSRRYEEFKQKCVNAYWVLRENARVIVNMFYLMIDSGIPELNNIESLNKLHDKFVPGYSKQEASNSFLNNLDESVNALMPVLMEKLHLWAQYWK